MVVRTFRVAALCALAIAVTGFASSEEVAGPGFQIEYSGSPAVPIVTYHIENGIETDDDTPLLQVFGDGRAVVHRPWHHQNAGDYALKLSETEMASLLEELHQKGVLTFDPKAVGEQRRAAQVERASAARAGAAELTESSDVEITIVRVQLDAYRPSSGASLQANFSKEVRSVNLQREARDFPQIAALQGLAHVEETLRAYTEDSRLRKLPAGASR